MIDRALRLPRRPKSSFFLWGPRQTGKSTLLRALYPQAHLKGLRELVHDHPRTGRRLVVSLGEQPRRT